jgi:hypothetical protein
VLNISHSIDRERSFFSRESAVRTLRPKLKTVTDNSGKNGIQEYPSNQKNKRKI